MRDYSFFMGAIFGALVFFTMMFLFIIPKAQKEVMRQAYERGHAVQCLGKTGYHWECEE